MIQRENTFASLTMKLRQGTNKDLYIYKNDLNLDGAFMYDKRNQYILLFDIAADVRA